MKCRGCSSNSLEVFLDLGMSPIANAFVLPASRFEPEAFYPLEAKVCTDCALVQIPEIVSPVELFSQDYAYLSSYSKTWTAHAERYAISMVTKMRLDSSSLVMEVASNDGYLLKVFKELGLKVIGIEPAQNAADIAISKGIPTICEFFGARWIKSIANMAKPDLLIGNNVLAHVPELHDFIEGVKITLASDGIATFEFPHLLNLIMKRQFDTIYHEHYSYLSITALRPVFAEHGLTLFDVEEISTHGGSLRIYVKHTNRACEIKDSVGKVLKAEKKYDPRGESVIRELQESALKIKNDLISELLDLQKHEKSVAAYGAAAKGNTLLNYVGVTAKLIKYVVDLNPEKQGKLLPGSHIPIVNMDALRENPPDILLILPWNIADEIWNQVRPLTPKNMKFLKAIPSVGYL